MHKKKLLTLTNDFVISLKKLRTGQHLLSLSESLKCVTQLQAFFKHLARQPSFLTMLREYHEDHDIQRDLKNLANCTAKSHF